MKKPSFLCSGVLTVFLAFATTACSDNPNDRTNSATTASAPSEPTYSPPSATGTSSSMGAGSGDVSSEYMLDPTGSGPGE